MAEMIEKPESMEQITDIEAQTPLITEYAELGQEAALSDYNDMAAL